MHRQQHRYLAQIEGLKAVANLVEVDEETFRRLLRSHERPTVVVGETGLWRFRRHTYLTTYDGFTFCLRSATPLDLHAEAPSAFLVRAKTVTIPFL